MSKQIKKCRPEQNIHYPDWSDHEIDYDIEQEAVFMSCNCRCWESSFTRVYELTDEYEDD